MQTGAFGEHQSRTVENAYEHRVHCNREPFLIGARHEQPTRTCACASAHMAGNDGRVDGWAGALGWAGVTGGTASGKTTVCEQIIHALSDQRVVLISQVRANANADARASARPRPSAQAALRRRQRRRSGGGSSRGRCQGGGADARRPGPGAGLLLLQPHAGAAGQRQVVQLRPPQRLRLGGREGPAPASGAWAGQETLEALRRGQLCHIPVYDYTTHQRSAETRIIESADVVIVEGIMVFHSPAVRRASPAGSSSALLAGRGAASADARVC
eukprot:scaffold431_cov315-Prasinococcus_capsulatus_cf.AAC.14